ncbi:MAG: murein biosynthesis integral membrane protein MurJ [Smithellaceae bacterium]
MIKNMGSPNSKSENASVAKAAGIVSFATMISRVFGLARDTVIAAFFGAGWMTDAFWVAYRIPNLLRRFLAEGALTVSFVPVFTEYLEKKGKVEALDLAYNVFTLLSIVSVVICMLGILLSPLVITLIAPGFLGQPEHFTLAVFLNRLMFPYLFFISLAALSMGILNAFRHFTTPALSPVMLNTAMILCAFILKDYFAQPITALAIGVLIGGFLQLALQWPFLLKFGFRFKFRFNWTHPGLQQIGLLFIPAVFSGAINTINVFVGTILATLQPAGSVTYLFYADRIMELPLGVFAIAVGTATLPSFSKHVALGHLGELKSSIAFSLRITLFLIIPAMVALLALSMPVISVLFQRGAFDARAALLTGQALFCYSLGLWAFAITRIFISSFYSLQDSKWPMRAAIITFAVNLAASLMLMGPLKHNGLALANSLAAMVNVAVLAFILRRKIGRFLDRAFFRAILKMTAAALAMLAVIGAVQWVFPWDINADFPTRLTFLAITIILGASAYFACAYILRSSEIHAVVGLIKKRLTRPQSPKTG